MALIAAHLDIIKKIQTQLLQGTSRISLLSLGYPDALITDAALKATLTPEQYSELIPVKDSEAILRWHGMGGMIPQVTNTQRLLSAMHLDAHYIDISPSRGIEEAVDLNHPLPTHLKSRFHLTLDLGTIEHCFNIGQCMMNVAGSVMLGGVVVHSNPIGFYDHGFFNFTPSFYTDFYGQNGFTIHYMKGLVGTPLSYELFDLGPQWRTQPLPAKSIVLVIAQRTEAKPIKWPVQDKYLANPGLKR